MTNFTIRQVQGEELLTTYFPLSEYAFQPTPPAQSRLSEWEERLHVVESYTFLVGFEENTPVAAVFSVPMTQAVRGKIYPMSGIAGVCSHPATRRKGYIRLLLQELLAAGKADNVPFAGLYPFRESFYERMGFVTFPQIKVTRFASQTLTPLLKYDLPGEVERLAMIDHLDVYEGFLDQHQAAVHGMSRFPAVPEEARHNRNPQWLAVARINGEFVGVMTYKIAKYGGDLKVTDFYHRNPEGLYLLLQWLARHVDQVSQIELDLPPYEMPETWLADLNAKIHTTEWVTPMGRVLDVAGIGGLQTGAGRFTARITDPHTAWNNGVFSFETSGGELVVTPAEQADCELTINGLSALIYGTHSPTTFAIRGWGNPTPETQRIMEQMFPRMYPHMHTPY